MDIIINWLVLSYCYANRIINLSTLIKLDLIGGGGNDTNLRDRERSDDLGEVGEGLKKIKTQELMKRIKCPSLCVSVHVYLLCCFYLSDVSSDCCGQVFSFSCPSIYFFLYSALPPPTPIKPSCSINPYLSKIPPRINKLAKPLLKT